MSSSLQRKAGEAAGTGGSPSLHTPMPAAEVGSHARTTYVSFFCQYARHLQWSLINPVLSRCTAQDRCRYGSLCRRVRRGQQCPWFNHGRQQAQETYEELTPAKPGRW